MARTRPTADLHRLAGPDHLCPWGLKALDLLRRNSFTINDHHLDSLDAAQAFKARNGVTETPQIWIDGMPIGGYDELRAHLGLRPEDPDAASYQPVIAVFAVAFALALAVAWLTESFGFWTLAGHFVALLMVLLGMLKLQNLSAFSVQFLNYDRLAQRVPRYAFVYPFVETGAGLLMLTGLLPWLAAPAALIVSAIGAWSVFKAVFLEHRKLSCACVGGNSRVPLGAVSLTENLLMLGMALVMLWHLTAHLWLR